MDEEYPFQRSGTVGPDHFWDRDHERRSLERLIRAGEIGFLEGPRRVGKSSLALIVKEELETKHGWRIAYLNLRTVTSASLPDRLVTAVASLAHHNPLAQATDRVRGMFSSFRVLPEFVGGFDDQGKPQASLRFQQFRREDEGPVLEDTLRLLARAPKHAQTKVALILDEFQEVLTLAPLLPNLLKASFQSGQNSAVVLMGSRQTLMEEIAHSPSAPLYRIGPSIPVGALPRQAARDEIKKRFERLHITLAAKLADTIYDISDGIAQDVQTVCAVLLDRARMEGWRNIDDSQLSLVLDDVLREVSSRFVDQWMELSPIQQELLAAIVQYGGKSITSQAFLDRLNPHRRRASAAVLKAATALKGHDILHSTEAGYRFSDPFFALYLRRVVVAPMPDMGLVS